MKESTIKRRIIEIIITGLS